MPSRLTAPSRSPCSGRGVVKGSARTRVRLLSSADAQHWTIQREFSADRVLSMTAGAARRPGGRHRAAGHPAPRLDMDRAERPLWSSDAGRQRRARGRRRDHRVCADRDGLERNRRFGRRVRLRRRRCRVAAGPARTDGWDHRGRVRATASFSRRVSVSRPGRECVRRLRRPAARGRAQQVCTTASPAPATAAAPGASSTAKATSRRRR